MKIIPITDLRYNQVWTDKKALYVIKRTVIPKNNNEYLVRIYQYGLLGEYQDQYDISLGGFNASGMQLLGILPNYAVLQPKTTTTFILKDQKIALRNEPRGASEEQSILERLQKSREKHFSLFTSGIVLDVIYHGLVDQQDRFLALSLGYEGLKQRFWFNGYGVFDIVGQLANKKVVGQIGETHQIEM